LSQNANVIEVTFNANGIPTNELQVAVFNTPNTSTGQALVYPAFPSPGQPAGVMKAGPITLTPNTDWYIFSYTGLPLTYSPTYLFFRYNQAFPPSTPTVFISQQNELRATFNSNGLSASDYIFFMTVSPTPNPLDARFTTFTVQETSTDTYVSEVMTLPVDVPNYIFSTARSKLVSETLFSLTPLVFQFNAVISAPQEPYLVFRDGVGIQVHFDTAGQTGVPPINYLIEISVVPDFSVSTNIATNLISGTIFGTPTFGINPSVLNYIRAQASNASGNARSPVFTFDPAETGAPSGPTSTPVVFGVPTQTAITVSYNTVGVTGNPPFATQCFASTSNTGPFNIGCIEQLISPNQYAATASGLLPNTNYYFQTIITNGVLPNQNSAVSAAILTAGGTTGAPTIPPSIPVLNSGPTQNVINVFINAAAVNGVEPVSINVVYDSNPSGAFSNLATIAPATAPDSYVATASGLSPGVTYYFKSEAVNPFGTIRSQRSAGFTTIAPGNNPFDNGYFPPRPWAPGVANYVAGVVSPFRQQ
jgi:hypothetical protein